MVGSPIFGTLTKKAVLPILHSLRDKSGQIDGYVYASFDLKRFALELHNNLHLTAVFAIWGANATLMARYPALPNWEGKTARDTPMAKFIAASGDGGVEDMIGLDGVQRIWASAKMPPQHGSDTWITVGLAKDEATAVAVGVTRILLISIGLGLMAASAVTILFVEVVVRIPLNRLLDAIRRFTGGDRGARIGAPYPRGELGELMKAADHIATHAEAEHEELTERLELRVAERTAELQVANDELESFSSSVAHDLRAPLRHVQGFSALLAADHGLALATDGRHCVDRIQEASSRVGSLIDDLLHLSRVTRAELHRDTVDLSESARLVFEMLASREPDRKMEWRVEPGMLVHGDRNLLTIAMGNLFGNAWKFTAHTDAPVINVGCEYDGQDILVWVQDNGAGFDMKYVDKLFQPFQRLHRADDFSAAVSASSPSNASSRGSAAKYGSKDLRAKGQGFVLHCPDEVMKTRHILLVDDSNDDIELAQRLLRKLASGTLQSVAIDGVQALEMLHAPEGERVLPDVIFLALKMPRLDGVDVLKALRADQSTQSIPVVIFSSSSERGDVQRCYALGANSYIQKPVNFEEYEGALRLLASYWLGVNELAY